MKSTTTKNGLGMSNECLTSAIWIDWGNHLRTRSLTERLGVSLIRIVETGNRMRRYVKSARETLKVIRQHKPRVVFSTNPSIVLGYVLLVLRARYRFALVTDAHYVGVQSIRKSPFVQALLDFYNRRADLVMVTNPNQADFLGGIGARSIVCPDPLPTIECIGERTLGLPEKSAFLICSFDADEPYEEVIRAFRDLATEGFTLYVSGNYTRSGLDPTQQPGVRFLGFVDEETYYAYLCETDIVMDLTILEDCLVCGAYEALAVGRPLILSGSSASRAYFREGCHFTENHASSIADAVRTAWKRREQLQAAARRWSERNEFEMESHLRQLAEEVTSLLD